MSLQFSQEEVSWPPGQVLLDDVLPPDVVLHDVQTLLLAPHLNPGTLVTEEPPKPFPAWLHGDDLRQKIGCKFYPRKVTDDPTTIL